MVTKAFGDHCNELDYISPSISALYQFLKHDYAVLFSSHYTCHQALQKRWRDSRKSVNISSSYY